MTETESEQGGTMPGDNRFIYGVRVYLDEGKLEDWWHNAKAGTFTLDVGYAFRRFAEAAAENHCNDKITVSLQEIDVVDGVFRQIATTVPGVHPPPPGAIREAETAQRTETALAIIEASARKHMDSLRGPDGPSGGY